MKRPESTHRALLVAAILICSSTTHAQERQVAMVRGPAVLPARPTEDPAGWRDIVALPPRPLLRRHRLALAPFYAVTLNDQLLRHHAVGAGLSFYLSEVLSVGVQGLYYVTETLDQEFYTRYHFARVPSLNRYRYTVALDFTYAPIYGKFHLLNDRILHFEIMATAGIGGSGTEIIPRDRRYAAFSNPFSLTFPAGVGGRLFLSRWLAVEAVFRCYVMLDRFEPSQRGKDPDPAREVELARDEAKTDIVNNMMFHVGVGIFLPPGGGRRP